MNWNVLYAGLTAVGIWIGLLGVWYLLLAPLWRVTTKKVITGKDQS